MAKKVDIIKSNSNLELLFLSQLIKDFDTNKFPPDEGLVFWDNKKTEIYIPKGIVSFLCGAGGVGKTKLLTDLAFSIAYGEKFINRMPVKHGYCCMFCAENTKRDIVKTCKRKTNNDFKLFSQFSDRLAIIPLAGTSPEFLNREDYETKFYDHLLKEVIRLEPKEGWDCIIFDPAARFMGCNVEAEASAATKFVTLLERIKDSVKGNPAIIASHHVTKSSISNGKSSQIAIRGSSALTDGCRLQINLERLEEDNLIRMVMVKSNISRIFPEIIMRLNITNNEEKIIADK